MKGEPTPEEYIQRLRLIAQAFTGLDPALGRVKKPVKLLTEDEIKELFKGKGDHAN